MDFKLLLFLFVFFIKQINSETHLFSLIYAYDRMSPATYIRPVSNNDKLYIVTGEDDINYGNKRHRYIIIYDIETASYLKTITYESDFGFWRGEPYLIGENSEYLFITTFNDENTFKSSFEIFDISKQTKEERVDSVVNGYRRAFIKAGSFYYWMNLKQIDGDGNYISIKKMKISYSYNFPQLEIIKSNDKAVKIVYQAMISCDITKNNNYILCAYYSEESKVAVSVFNTELSYINTNTYENVGYDDGDRYIKILYLNDDSNFVLMNSHTDNIIRFRYFNYKYNQFTEKTSKITKNLPYIDIKNTQTKGHDGENDMIKVGSDKIITISDNISGNNLFITIIQFYDDIAISIKIYEMVNNDGFMYMIQNRIAMLKDSLVVCLSSTKNDIHKPGYFIVNYPNSTDINLKQSNIIIKNIISLENKIFSLKLKFKVLSIPNGFVFISKSNSKIIKQNDILELEDQLLLKEFRVNEGPYILQYKPIAIGTDSGYSLSYKYPSNQVINDNDVIIEGRHGKITIDLKSCLDGFYYIENYPNLCIKDKPKNYYLDEINKIYRPCSSSCDECKPPYEYRPMNCINCIPNYYMTEDTHSCYNSVIDNYFLEDNKLKRCHENCLQCTSRQNKNCKKCQNNLYLTEDYKSCYEKGIDNYFLDSRFYILRKCHKNCLKCSSAHVNNEYMNCDSCKSGYYITEETKSCFKKGIDNYFLEDNKLKRCHENCLQCTSKENKNCIKCKQDYYLTNDTKSCYPESVENYYLEDNILIRCHSNCLKCKGPALNSTHMNCISCPDKYYMIEDTKSCYNTVIDNYYLDKDNNILRKCHPNCKNCVSEENENCINCISGYYLTEYTHSCYKGRIAYYYFDYVEELYKHCHSRCWFCSSGPKDYSHMNCDSCKDSWYYYPETKSCIDYIPNHYYKEKNSYILKKCYERCYNCIEAANSKTMNCLGCVNDTFFYNNETYDCILPSEFNEKTYLNFFKVSNVNFIIFIIIFVLSIIIFILFCRFYKIKDIEKKDESNNKKLNKKLNQIVEMEEIKNNKTENDK